MAKNNSMDEKTMIREQERLVKEAKRRKTRKFKIGFGVVAAVAVVGGSWYVSWGRNLAVQTASTTVKIEKSMGQTVVYAKITEINGNEITYAIAEKVEEVSAGTENGAASPEEGNAAETEAGGEGRGQRGQGGMSFGEGEMPDMSNMPSAGDGSMPDMSQMPSGGEGMPSFREGEMPDMSQMGGMPSGGGENATQSVEGSSTENGGMGGRGQKGQGGMSFGDGEMPDMSNMPSAGDGTMPDMNQMGGRGNAVSTVSSIDQFTYDGITYRVGEETVTTYIPVGTNITTKLGTVTTFSRLAADDYVALIMDKDGDEEVIAAVYIVG